MTDVTPAIAPAEPTNPPPRPYRLLRLREGKVFGGVAGGLGRAAGIDLTLARLAVFGACLTGIGLVVYFVLWLILPQEAPWRGDIVQAAPEPTGRYLRMGLAGAGVVGVLNVLGELGGALSWSRTNWAYGPGPHGPDFGGAFGLMLLAFGAGILITRRRDRDRHPPAPATPGDASSSWSPLDSDADPDSVQGAGAQPTEVLTTAPSPSDGPGTPRSLIAARVLGWFVVVWAVVAAGAGFLLWWAGALRPGAPELSIPIGVIAFVGVVWALVRARRAATILVALFVLLLPVVLASRVELFGDLGVRDLRPTDATVERSYRIAAGQLILDLRDLDVPVGTRRLRVDMGAGQVTVRLPANVTSDVTVRTHLGGAAVLGDVRGGNDTVTRGHIDGCPDRGHLVLNVQVRVGHVEVEGPGTRLDRPVCATPVPT